MSIRQTVFTFRCEIQILGFVCCLVRRLSAATRRADLSRPRKKTTEREQRPFSSKSKKERNNKRVRPSTNSKASVRLCCRPCCFPVARWLAGWLRLVVRKTQMSSKAGRCVASRCVSVIAGGVRHLQREDVVDDEVDVDVIVAVVVDEERATPCTLARHFRIRRGISLARRKRDGTDYRSRSGERRSTTD